MDIIAVQSVLNEISKEDPRAKGVKAEGFVENRLLGELERSGLVQQLAAERI